MRARHTRIKEIIETPEGRLVREDYYGYPKGASNVYLVNSRGAILWEAELPMNDVYANSLFVDGAIFRCATWNGFTCTLSLATGKIISEKFTK